MDKGIVIMLYGTERTHFAERNACACSGPSVDVGGSGHA